MKLELINIILRILAAFVQQLCCTPLPPAERQAKDGDESFPFQSCNANLLCAVNTLPIPVARNGILRRPASA
jgi:hypothetical protein